MIWRTPVPYFLPPDTKGYLQIHSTGGELIDEYALEPGYQRLEISLTGLSPGIYLYGILIVEQVKTTKKMVLEK